MILSICFLRVVRVAEPLDCSLVEESRIIRPVDWDDVIQVDGRRDVPDPLTFDAERMLTEIPESEPFP